MYVSERLRRIATEQEIDLVQQFLRSSLGIQISNWEFEQRHIANWRNAWQEIVAKAKKWAGIPISEPGKSEAAKKKKRVMGELDIDRVRRLAEALANK